MGEVLLYQQRQVTEVCCNCGIVFSMPQEIRNLRYSDKGTFFCPNGHSQHYVGESDADKIARLAKDLARAKKERNAERAARKRAAARIEKGVCTKCNRTFQNVARHMASKHGSAK